MTEYQSLSKFKEEQKISDNNGYNISLIYHELFNEHLNNELSRPNTTKSLLDNLLEECKEVNPTLIPYAELTNIVFASYYDNGAEVSFTEKLKSEFEKHITNKFRKQTDIDRKHKIPKTNDELFKKPNPYDGIGLTISDEYKNSILVIYKIIQHSELAISQKKSLYENLKDDIDYMRETVGSATHKYDNMMSNFISILGIFAAIMMATFGAIQGFTAIYSNENDYNLTTIILISCFGLFALISILYLLLYSISRLVDKELRHGYYSDNLFDKYPIYSHTLVVISIIFLLALTHLFKINPPNYFPNHLTDNIWEYTILASIIIILVYYLHLLIAQSQGYWHLNRLINDYIMSIKDTLGLNKLLNILILIIIAIFTTVIAFIVYSIFN